MSSIEKGFLIEPPVLVRIQLSEWDGQNVFSVVEAMSVFPS